MSNLGGMSDAATLGVAGTALFFILAYLADIYTTMIGTQHGDVEKAFVTKNLMKLCARFKWLNLQLLQVIAGTIVLFIGGAFTNYGPGKAALFFGVVGAGEAVQAFRNYRLLKEQKISLK